MRARGGSSVVGDLGLLEAFEGEMGEEYGRRAIGSAHQPISGRLPERGAGEGEAEKDVEIVDERERAR